MMVGEKEGISFSFLFYSLFPSVLFISSRSFSFSPAFGLVPARSSRLPSSASDDRAHLFFLDRSVFSFFFLIFLLFTPTSVSFLSFSPFRPPRKAFYSPEVLTGVRFHSLLLCLSMFYVESQLVTLMVTAFPSP